MSQLRIHNAIELERAPLFELFYRKAGFFIRPTRCNIGGLGFCFMSRIFQNSQNEELKILLKFAI